MHNHENIDKTTQDKLSLGYVNSVGLIKGNFLQIRPLKNYSVTSTISGICQLN
jgi:hypothetical protein